MQKLLPNEVRILGGRWRGRKLAVVGNHSLRPTPSRVRETLFNWLMFDIKGTVCLDLFAGTGALGFEALSRGAQKIALIESEPSTVAMLQKNAEKFEASAVEIHQMTAENFLKNNKMIFDIVFIDPPFHENKLSEIVNRLLRSHSIHENTLFYVEGDELPDWPADLILRKSSKAGQVHFGLLKKVLP